MSSANGRHSSWQSTQDSNKAPLEPRPNASEPDAASTAAAGTASTPDPSQTCPVASEGQRPPVRKASEVPCCALPACPGSMASVPFSRDSAPTPAFRTPWGEASGITSTAPSSLVCMARQALTHTDYKPWGKLQASPALRPAPWSDWPAASCNAKPRSDADCDQALGEASDITSAAPSTWVRLASGPMQCRAPIMDRLCDQALGAAPGTTSTAPQQLCRLFSSWLSLQVGSGQAGELGRWVTPHSVIFVPKLTRVQPVNALSSLQAWVLHPGCDCGQ